MLNHSTNQSPPLHWSLQLQSSQSQLSDNCLPLAVAAYSAELKLIWQWPQSCWACLAHVQNGWKSDHDDDDMAQGVAGRRQCTCAVANKVTVPRLVPTGLHSHLHHWQVSAHLMFRCVIIFGLTHNMKHHSSLYYAAAAPYHLCQMQLRVSQQLQCTHARGAS